MSSSSTGTIAASYRERRGTLLRLAVYGSGVSKITAIALQGLAIPLVYRALGPHQYALYVLLSGVLATITLLQMGAGPGLTRELAQAHAAEDRNRETGLFAAAVTFTAAVAALGAIIVAVTVRTLPTNVIFGDAFRSDRPEIIHATDICAALLALHIVLGVVDSALAGYQEQVFTGISTSISNIASTCILCLICVRTPSIVAIVLTLYGLPVCARLANLVLLLRRRPHLLFGLKIRSHWPFRVLVHTGMGFWVIQLGSLLEQNAGPFLLAHLSTPQAVGIFAITFKICGFAGSIAGTLTQPLWPSFTDAIARNDFHWVLSIFRRMKCALVSLSVLIAVAISFTGKWFLVRVFHTSVESEHWLILVLAIYLVTNIWTHLHYVTLMGITDIWQIAGIALLENCIMVALGVVFCPIFRATGMALAYLIASVALPAWLLPQIFNHASMRTASTCLSSRFS